MAITLIQDIISYENFLDYSQLLTKELSALLSSGAVRTSPLFAGLASGGGSTVNIPYFEDLDGSSEVLSDVTPLTPAIISSVADRAAILRRGKSWASNELAAALAGSDPMTAIARLTGGFWARDIQKTLIEQLKGIFGSASMSEAIVSIKVADGTANATAASKIGFGPVIDTLATMGDAYNDLGIMLCHSQVYFALLKSSEERIIPASSTIPFATYLGRRVIVDDGLPVRTVTGTAKSFSTYFMGSGALAYGVGSPQGVTSFETERDALAGVDRLVNRNHYFLHLSGVKWAGDSEGVSPTNAELATPTNWVRVFPRKNIPVALLIHNI